MDSFILKIIAMITMVIDHVGFTKFDNLLIMRVIGRCAFLIYAFLMAECFYHTRNNPKRINYHLRKLVILTLLSEIPFDYMAYGSWDHPEKQSVAFTLLIAYGCLTLMKAPICCPVLNENLELNRNPKLNGNPKLNINPELNENPKLNKKKVEENLEASREAIWKSCWKIRLFDICLLFAAMFISYFIRTDYSIKGVLLIYLFYLYLSISRKRTLKTGVRIIALLFIITLYWIIYNLVLQPSLDPSILLGNLIKRRYYFIPHVLMAFLLAFYNGRQGYHGKFFNFLYSWIYPIHIAILVIMK